MHSLSPSRILATLGLALGMVTSSPVSSEPIPLPNPAAVVDPLILHLPTANTALFDDRPEQFFQHVNRYRNGRRLTPWQGGAYGFVRNPWEIEGRTVYTRLHEGIDIQPVYRTSEGEPLDTVRTVSSGHVVYTNRETGQSNYGKYIVVEHLWDGSPFYSLYAHLSDIFVDTGDYVNAGDHLARMGYTGRGIDRRRAHVHVEIAMLLNERFQPWYDNHFKREPNYHNLFSGLNLRGMDVTTLLRQQREDPNLTIQEFVRDQELSYTITVPTNGGLNLLKRYPWLWEGPADLDSDTLSVVSIGFTRTGLPVRVTTADEAVERVKLSGVENTMIHRQCATNGILRKHRTECTVGRRGERYLELIAM
jgi:murein DD-endopeptidase MepM/ murein hydrolase activator NlpD